MRRVVTLAVAGLAVAACQQDPAEVAVEDPDETGVDDATQDGQTESGFQTDEGEFFEAPEIDEGMPDDMPPGGYAQPEWSGAPDNEIGSMVPTDPIVIEGDDVAVAVMGVTAYSTGLEFEVSVRAHPDAAEDVHDPSAPAGPMEPMMGGPGAAAGEDGELPDDLLRVGFAFPDGSTASSVDRAGPPSLSPDDEPEGPILATRSGGGGGLAWDHTMWLWPLPEPGEGPLEFVAQWPEHGIDLERAELDVEEVAAAVDRVVELWPDDRPAPPGPEER